MRGDYTIEKGTSDMKDILYMAWRYVLYNRLKKIILVAISIFASYI